MADVVFKATYHSFTPKAVNWGAVIKELGFKDEQAAKKAFYDLCERQRWFVVEETTAEGSQPGTSNTPPKPINRQSKTIPNKRRRYNTRSSAKDEAEAELDDTGPIERSGESSNFDDLFDIYTASNEAQFSFSQEL
ncbi:uncharacterized protein F4812DRAFT_467147 [Daldinia caldariorum]|uniref:uncharacterized protein n=1 Tax=Daldinia caldariorum TaxID=326644 RepID=UPI00200833E6|nr:uncharacterized protein F4812DRAFT_467147 [Daldinia caldariorum]KAI1464560.1 hypothetical protein F4812DRAFT_467147 [Daldinia caldariorum]